MRYYSVLLMMLLQTVAFHAVPPTVGSYAATRHQHRQLEINAQTDGPFVSSLPPRATALAITRHSTCIKGDKECTRYHCIYAWTLERPKLVASGNCSCI